MPNMYLNLMNRRSRPICNQLKTGTIFEPVVNNNNTILLVWLQILEVIIFAISATDVLWRIFLSAKILSRGHVVITERSFSEFIFSLNLLHGEYYHPPKFDTALVLYQIPSISCQLTATSAIGILRYCAMYNISTSNALQHC